MMTWTVCTEINKRYIWRYQSTSRESTTQYSHSINPQNKRIFGQWFTIPTLKYILSTLPKIYCGRQHSVGCSILPFCCPIRENMSAQNLIDHTLNIRRYTLSICNIFVYFPFIYIYNMCTHVLFMLQTYAAHMCNCISSQGMQILKVFAYFNIVMRLRKTCTYNLYGKEQIFLSNLKEGDLWLSIYPKSNYRVVQSREELSVTHW